MLRKKIRFVTSVAVSLLALAMIASGKDKNASKDTSTTLSVMSDLTLGGQNVKPGVYTVKATDTSVAFELHGKTIAQAPAEWKDGKDKAGNSTLLTESGAIKEIHFSGNTKYLVIGTAGTSASQ